MDKVAIQTKPEILTEKPKSVQKLRLYSQLVSLAINIWIGVQFYFFVGYLKSGGEQFYVSRSPGVDGWLPIGSLVSLRYWWESGIINEIHPAGLIIFMAIMVTAYLFKKGFCSWVCPIGLVSEVLGNISDKIFKRRIKPPKWLDWPLRSLKYIILGFFIWAILISMTPESTKAFIYSDYNKMTDVLMLKFFTDISAFSLWVIATLIALSLVVRGFWCRYLCPYGGLLGLFSLISPTRIVRNQKSCIDCSACTHACPSFIKVESVKEVVSDECSGCMACVDICPVNNTLDLVVVKKKRRVSTFKWAAVLLLVFWGGLLVFKVAGPWQNSVTEAEYMKHMPSVEQGTYVHP